MGSGGRGKGVCWKAPMGLEAHSAFSPSSVRADFVALPDPFPPCTCTPPLLLPRQCHATMLHGWGTTNMNWSRHSALMNGRREFMSVSASGQDIRVHISRARETRHRGGTTLCLQLVCARERGDKVVVHRCGKEGRAVRANSQVGPADWRMQGFRLWMYKNVVRYSFASRVLAMAEQAGPLT